jgi:hypothetical protein
MWDLTGASCHVQVFSYLEAKDVLAMAEVCKSFYDRVGAIFGKPGAGGSSSNDSSSGGLGMSASGARAGGVEAGAGDSGPLPPSRASAAAKAVLDESPITEKVATSIASKLTSSEMKGIIGLTEKLKKLEAVVLQMQAENEDLRARLQVGFLFYLAHESVSGEVAEAYSGAYQVYLYVL